MLDLWMDYEELWEPWELEIERPMQQNGEPRIGWEKVELPAELHERFMAAKKEIEEVWAEIKKHAEQQ